MGPSSQILYWILCSLLGGTKREINDPWRSSDGKESRERHIHYSSETNYKNPISLDCNCLITVIISLHEGSFIKEKPNDLKVNSPRRLTSLANGTTRTGNKNLVKPSCWRCVIQHFGEKDDSHFTESGQSVKCYNKLELLFPPKSGAAWLWDFPFEQALHIWFVCVSRGGLEFKVST